MSGLRAYWSGTLQVGLLALPVKLYGAASSHDTRFRLLHGTCETPIEQVRRCRTCERDVAFDELVKGVEVQRGAKGQVGQFVVVTEGEMDALPLPTAGAIVLQGFLPAGVGIPHVIREKTVYLGPDEQARRPYALLHRALFDGNRLGLGKVAIRGREHLVAVEPWGPTLVLSQLYFADEVKEALDVPDLPVGEEFRAEELLLASQVIEALTLREKTWADITDASGEALASLIASKRAGLPVDARREPVLTGDIMAALRASLEKARAEMAA